MPTPVPDGSLCLSCSYALRGLDTRRCPECGRAFDPDVPLTMKLAAWDRLTVALLRPTGRWGVHTMRALAALGMLGPAWLTPSNALACNWLSLWAVFIFACWCRSFARYVAALVYKQPPEVLRVDDAFRRRTRRAFVIVTLLVLTRAPFLLALLVSRPWLDHQAHYYWAVQPANVDPPRWPRMQALLLVRRIDATPTYVTFNLFGGGYIIYHTTLDGQTLECTWNTWQDDWHQLW